MRHGITILAALSGLAACGGRSDDAATADNGPVSETVMDNVDDLHGTIGDDMIAIDDVRSQAPTAGDQPESTEDGAKVTDGDVSADGSPPADSGPSDQADAE
ncbi:hypothetical protein [Novosphingopyxis sp.]|uniref:hypothetical protein n=1 Tax=Novosphingopyxis sp. TaxID=2709690 RepID=UPI003B5C95E4